MLDDFDKGPTKELAKLFAHAPDYTAHKEHFWFDWGPVYYRGRLDKRVKVLCIASDPGPTERLTCRNLVGDAGQRVQGFLAKLGLTHSYLCLNAFLYALHPSHFFSAKDILELPDHVTWRNKVFNRLVGTDLQAVIAFGSMAQLAVDLWTDVSVPVFKVAHPSFREEEELLAGWREAIPQLRAIITPDSDGNNTSPNYGTTFTEADYAPIPRRDLPFGIPSWIGDDAWGRTGTPKHNNCVSRPNPDDAHTLVWIAPNTDPPV